MTSASAPAHATSSAEAPAPSPSSTARAELRDAWLRVHFGDGDHADFHYRWLRHNCDQDRHPLTNERILDSSELPERIAPARAYVDPERRALFVHWGERAEDRVSRYALSWLREHAYARNRVEVPPPPSDVASITVDATKCASDEALLEAMFALLHSRGGAVVTGFRVDGRPPQADDTERLVQLFEAAGYPIVGTHFGRIEDLRTDNTTNQNTDQLGYTDAPVDVHTDQPFLDHPPFFQLLHCIRPAEQGGDSALVDAWAAARYLAAEDADAYRLLTTVPVHFHRKQKSFESLVVAPILSGETRESFMIRYSYFTMDPYHRPFNEMEAWYRAYDRLARLVRDERFQYRARLAAGDFVVYDNRRMLHARTGFRGARWMRGVYFSPKGHRG